MIYTITLNPSIDYFLTLTNKPIIDEVNRGTNGTYKVGGKGINVSKILSLYNIKSKAIVLLGGFSGQYIYDTLNKDNNIEVIDIAVNGINRINVKAHYDNKALCINGDGPVADRNVIDMILASLSKLNSDDIVVISGSMMKGLDNSLLVEITSIVNKQKAKLVIDMEQIDLNTLRLCKPWLIKPNLYELKLLLNNEDITKDNVEVYLQQLHLENIDNILLSLGKDGAILSTIDNNYYLHQPDTILVNKVGAGDAMLASFIGMISLGKDYDVALAYGGAGGNAVASKLEDITIKDIENYLPLMSVNKSKN